MSFLRKLIGGEEPLSGGSASRRQKTYSAESGYVFQYVFEGFRQTARGGERGYEYVFNVSPNRREWFPVSVFLGSPVLERWSAKHRAFTASERFAISKIALRFAFDAQDDPNGLRSGIQLGEKELDAIVEVLDIL